jgi:UDP-glucuronate 4-epimerase
MHVLVTGTAGFIGFHVARALMARGDAVTGFDNLNDYYDVRLKEARLAELGRVAAETGAGWRFLRADLAEAAAVAEAFADPGESGAFHRVIHLAAQAGVRHSLEHPADYVRSNIVGFTHVLEACRRAETPHLTYASN